jgi:hypothetical protein
LPAEAAAAAQLAVAATGEALPIVYIYYTHCTYWDLVALFVFFFYEKQVNSVTKILPGNIFLTIFLLQYIPYITTGDSTSYKLALPTRSFLQCQWRNEHMPEVDHTLHWIPVVGHEKPTEQGTFNTSWL